MNSSSPVVHVTRSVDPFVRLRLFVNAGGRCQFDACNKFLLEHHVTLTAGNFAEIAHVVAFRESGPRGRGNRPANINQLENLMLLCPACHKLVDDHPEDFTRATLEGYKERHERRIHHVTGLGPEQKTSLVVLKSKIGEQTVAFPFDQLLEAITPRYPISKEGLTIDLTQLSTDGNTFIATACDTIREELRIFFAASGEFKKSGHVSLFALAPIPLLVYLGNQLSNKVPLELYQRHRDTEDWRWKTSHTKASYAFRQIREGAVGSDVVLVVALSGTVSLNSGLPTGFKKAFPIFELTLDGADPRPTFLETKADLDQFRVAYQEALARLMRTCRDLRRIHLLPAIPAPVAVLCGRELLPKVHPQMLVYDFDKRKGGFTYQLTIN